MQSTGRDLSDKLAVVTGESNFETWPRRVSILFGCYPRIISGETGIIKELVEAWR